MDTQEHKREPAAEGADSQQEASVEAESPEAAESSLVEELSAQLAEATAQFQRTRADLANVRRRQRDEIERVKKRSLSGLGTHVVRAVEDIERALDVANGPGTDPALSDGLSLARRSLLRALASNGITPIDATGRAFDPTEHEAVHAVPPPAGVGGNVVLKVLQRGWLIDDAVLSPARVVVTTSLQTGAGKEE